MYRFTYYVALNFPFRDIGAGDPADRSLLPIPDRRGLDTEILAKNSFFKVAFY